jgi:hypothetical protein
MSGVYTNIARKRIEQSHEASHAPQKATDPQPVVTPPSNAQLSTKAETLPNEAKKPTKPQNRLPTTQSPTIELTEKPEKYTTHISPSLVKKVKFHALENEINDYDVINNALLLYFDRNK